MSDKKIEVVASFARTKQVAQYEPVNYFSSRKIELDADATLEDQRSAHKELFALCVLDVMEDMKTFALLTGEEEGVSVPRLLEMVQEVEKGGTLDIEEFQKLNAGQMELINEAKKAYKRSNYVSKAKGKKDE